MKIRTPQDLGAAVRGRRRSLKLSQAQVAKSARVSRPWLSEFESGKPTVEVSRVLAVPVLSDSPWSFEHQAKRRLHPTAADQLTCWTWSRAG